MRTRTIAVGVLAVGVLGASAALATGSATTAEASTITACQKKFLRVVSDASKCRAASAW